MKRNLIKILALVLTLGMLVPMSAFAASGKVYDVTVSITDANSEGGSKTGTTVKDTLTMISGDAKMAEVLAQVVIAHYPKDPNAPDMYDFDSKAMKLQMDEGLKIAKQGGTHDPAAWSTYSTNCNWQCPVEGETLRAKLANYNTTVHGVGPGTHIVTYLNDVADDSRCGVTYTVTITIREHSYSGGGSVTPTTPTVTVPVSGDENKVNVSATVSGNNAAVKELTDQEVEKVLGASVETGIVEIDLSGLGTEISSATIPTVTINKIADATKETGNDASGMSVKLSTATVTFDAAATQEISQQANGSTIQLVVDDIQEVSLNTAQKTAVEKLDTALVVDAYLVSNGARLCSESKGGFGGGKATVVLPYEIESNRSAANYSVYYVDDAGKLERLNARYDSTLGAFVFDITHFSNYVVAYEKNASAFVDVKTSDYFYNAVLWAAENGITNGVDSTHFGPSVPVTRAQVVTFLWRAAGCPEPKGNAGKFVDVPANDYYAKAVAWAIEQTITKGTSDTTFSPKMICTRGQIVTFLARFAGVADAETASVFADVQATDYFAAAVKWAKDNGVTSGTSATTFSPNRNCTRAEVVTFLYRWMVR